MVEPANRTVTVTTEIDAPPAAVYAIISDLPRMGEHSPENTGGRWLGGANGPAVGARFKGSNKKDFRRWSTTVTVTDATDPRRFAFDVDFLGIPIAAWCYEITDRPGGCTVSETYRDRRPAWMRLGSAPVMGVSDRAEHNTKGMEQTLASVKNAAESATAKT
ncbi:MAG TPA: SRPBCC family protein [Mycobacteriales bacterium]|nr:SRPBCC family protein [Mycobacteriales bacterium]